MLHLSTCLQARTVHAPTAVAAGLRSTCHERSGELRRRQSCVDCKGYAVQLACHAQASPVEECTGQLRLGCSSCWRWSVLTSHVFTDMADCGGVRCCWLTAHLACKRSLHTGMQCGSVAPKCCCSSPSMQLPCATMCTTNHVASSLSGQCVNVCRYGVHVPPLFFAVGSWYIRCGRLRL